MNHNIPMFEALAQNRVTIPLLKAANEGLACEKIGDVEGAISALAYIQRQLEMYTKRNNSLLSRAS